MHRAFIVIDDTLENELKKSIAQLYVDVFSSPPWNETWSLDEALYELDFSLAQPGFYGVASQIDGELVGFSWGYTLPQANQGRFEFAEMSRTLEENQINPVGSFYLGEVGVRYEFQNQGVGTLLAQEQCKDLEGTVVFRTKNPPMVRIYNKMFGDELFSFPEQSAYAGGRTYVFEVNK